MNDFRRVAAAATTAIAEAGTRVNIPATSLKPDLGLVTSTTTDSVDNTGTSSSTVSSSTYPDPVTGLAATTVVDPTGLRLTSASTYETKGASGSFLRKLFSTLPAGFDAAGTPVSQPGGGAQAGTTSYGYYGGTEPGPTTTGCANVASNQAGRMKTRTKPDPDGTGPTAPIVEEFAYDTSGRVAAMRTVGDTAWSCISYDTRGRPTTLSYPGFVNPTDATLNTAGRTVSNVYSVSGNPLKSKVTDSSVAGSVVSSVDLRGRVVESADVSGYVTSTVFDVAGRVSGVTVKSPGGTTVESLGYTFNVSGSGVNDLAAVVLDGVQQAAVTYDAVGRPVGYGYGNGTAGTAAFDGFQRLTGRSFAAGGASVAADVVVRDAKTAMVVDESVDGVDANPAGANFGYDRAGRLTSWWGRDAGSGNRFQGGYGFTGYVGTAPGCGNVQWGRDSNRLSSSRNTYNGAGTLIASSVDQGCFDNADRLTGYVPGFGSNPYAGVAYDSHGNTVRMGGEVHGYDSAGRHVVTTAPTVFRNVLLVVGNPAALSDRDVWFQQRLTALGWTVTIVDDDVATSASASGRQLVVISESASQAGVGTKFTSVAVPLINQETFLSDELGMTTAANQGITSGSTQTQVTVTAAGAGHQLGGGFGVGNVALASAGMDWGWNVPAASALVAATLPGEASKALIYAYQTGAVMASGTAPAPRVAWPHYAGSPTYLNANATVLFNAMVGWATNTQVRYTRDPAGRITTRSVNGTVTGRYVYAGAGDSPALTLDAAGAVIERTVGLPGGVLVTKRGTAASDVWSYPNVHGDVVATANGSGVKNGVTKGYDPYGNPLGATTLPDNSVGEFDYGWHGQQQRPLEHQAGVQPLVEMGARQYDPLTGRFLQTDPIEGGCANSYAYGHVEPLNSWDLSGLRADCNALFSKVVELATRVRSKGAGGTKGLAQRYSEMQEVGSRNYQIFGRHRVAYENQRRGLGRKLGEWYRDCNGKNGPPSSGESLAIRHAQAWADRNAPTWRAVNALRSSAPATGRTGMAMDVDSMPWWIVAGAAAMLTLGSMASGAGA